MKAARFYTAGDVRVDEMAAPQGAAGPHDALVRNLLCGICGSDMHEYRDGPVYTSREPHPVTDLQVSRLPDDLSDAAGALVEPAAVAVHAAASAPVQPGDAVLITGGGPIGQLVALATVALGAGTVVLSELNGGRRARADALGIGFVVDPVNDDLAAVVADASGGRGADVAIECSGSPLGLDACLSQVRKGGTVVQTALQARPVEIDVSAHRTLRDVTLKGMYCYAVTSWPRVIRLMASGRLAAERIVTGQILLDDISEQGFKALLDPDGNHVKILVET